MARTASLNCFDIPEMLPGARPSANPAQRHEFERRSKWLHLEEEIESTQEVLVRQAAAGATIACNELAEMFPMFHPDLVGALRAEAPSAQQAIETLLALSASAAEPANLRASVCNVGEVSGADAPSRDVGIQDHSRFPSLMHHSGQQAETGELGTAWRDRANAAKDKPAPRRCSRPLLMGSKKPGPKKEEVGSAVLQPLSDYESRHLAGEQRRKHRSHFRYRGGDNRAIVPECVREGIGGVTGCSLLEVTEEIDLAQV